MAKTNVPFLAFNRGIISEKALARTDLERTRLSAETMNNWVAKTQGNMTIRPGTKYKGSSFNDTGAVFIEFVAAIDSVALCEVTNRKLRFWTGSDAHALSLLSRPSVSTTVSFSDTGWSKDHIGGGVRPNGGQLGSGVDVLPTMTGETTDGVTITSSSTASNGWVVADDDPSSVWLSGVDGYPHQVNVDFGASNTKQIKTFTITNAASVSLPPKDFSLEGTNDTGAGWDVLQSVTGEVAWGLGEKRTYTDTGFSDTGTDAYRYFRLNVTDGLATDGAQFAEFELFENIINDTGQSFFSSAGLTLNAGAVGSTSRVRRRVMVDTGDVGVEHCLDINVSRGPVLIRVGANEGEDGLVSQASLATGYHNLAFTPTGSEFHITLQTSDDVDRVIRRLAIGDSGTVEMVTPWQHSDLDNIRYDQSADVVFCVANNVKQQRVERRGDGRSWSVVDYTPRFGPYRVRPSEARLRVLGYSGNVQMSADREYFEPGHQNSLFTVSHNGQTQFAKLGEREAATNIIEVTGISDTGTATAEDERQVFFSVYGNYQGTVEIQRSFDGPDGGFHPAQHNFMQNFGPADTGTFTRTVRDQDDNITVWYRAVMKDYTSGTATVAVTYQGGVTDGAVRVTNFVNSQLVDVEVVRPPSDSGATLDWRPSAWSGVYGYPSSLALHEGRLAFAGRANFWLSVSDDYDNFDEFAEGDAGPIIRSFGSGPVDDIRFLLSIQRLIAGTVGTEVSIKSSSLDEVLTPSNAAARPFSSLGSANLRAIKRDIDGFFVQRSNARLYRINIAADSFDYETSDMSLMVPELMQAGVVSVALQRQPDTRIHCVLADGTVAILTFEPGVDAQVLAWTTWSTDGFVERAMVLPGTPEDAVYYHIRRTINGVTRRYLEKWALESECVGDTGLSWLMDCAVSQTDTGRTSTITGIGHLAGKSVVAWGDDTGQPDAGKDLSPDVDGVQTTYGVDTGTGSIALTEDVHHAVVGLPYQADWKSTKLAYAAEAGTALAQMKRTDKLAFVLCQTHNNALFFGSDTGNLDPMPRITDEGAEVDADKIYKDFDQTAIPFPGEWSEDARAFVRGKSPRPATVLAAIPTVNTEDKV